MAKIRQVGKLNIITCNKENDLNGDNNDENIGKIVCYLFDSCEKMVVTEFDCTRNHRPNNYDFFMT